MVQYTQPKNKSGGDSLATKSQKTNTQAVVDIAQYRGTENVDARTSAFDKVMSQMKIDDRNAFDEKYRQRWREASDESALLSILLCDIDYFKAYKDNYGEQSTSFMLIMVALELRKICDKHNCFLAYYQNEGFAILHKGNDEEQPLTIAEDLRKAIEASKTEHKHSKVSSIVTLSIGVSSIYPNSMKLLMQKADQSLQQVKKLATNKAEAQQTEKAISNTTTAAVKNDTTKVSIDNANLQNDTAIKPTADINLKTDIAETPVADAIIKTDPIEELSANVTITDTAIESDTTEAPVTDTAIKSDTTEAPITDTASKNDTTQTLIADTAIKSDTTKTSITDASINSDTTKISIADPSINSDTTKTSIADVSINSDTTKTSIVDAPINSDTTKTSVADASINSDTTKTSVADTSINSDTTKTSVADTSIKSSIKKAPATKRTIKDALRALIGNNKADDDDDEIETPIQIKKEAITNDTVNNDIDTTASPIINNTANNDIDTTASPITNNTVNNDIDATASLITNNTVNNNIDTTASIINNTINNDIDETASSITNNTVNNEIDTTTSPITNDEVDTKPPSSIATQNDTDATSKEAGMDDADSTEKPIKKKSAIELHIEALKASALKGAAKNNTDTPGITTSTAIINNNTAQLETTIEKKETETPKPLAFGNEIEFTTEKAVSTSPIAISTENKEAAVETATTKNEEVAALKRKLELHLAALKKPTTENTLDNENTTLKTTTVESQTNLEARPLSTHEVEDKIESHTEKLDVLPSSKVADNDINDTETAASKVPVKKSAIERHIEALKTSGTKNTLKNNADPVKTPVINNTTHNNPIEQNTSGSLADNAESNQFKQRLLEMKIENESAFNQKFETLWQECCDEEEFLSLVISCVDFFKPYIEHYGKEASEEALIAVAASLNKACEKNGAFIYHLKNERFVVLLKGGNATKALKMAEKMRVLVAESCKEHKASKVSNVITMSVGISSLFPSNVNSIEMLNEESEDAYQMAIKSGRNQTCLN